MAGAGFQLSERVILDLGYRFIDMGKAHYGTADSSGFTNTPPCAWTTSRPMSSRSACAFISAAEPRGPAPLRSPDRRPGPVGVRATPASGAQFALI